MSHYKQTHQKGIRLERVISDPCALCHSTGLSTRVKPPPRQKDPSTGVSVTGTTVSQYTSLSTPVRRAGPSDVLLHRPGTGVREPHIPT